VIVLHGTHDNQQLGGPEAVLMLLIYDVHDLLEGNHL
jgi:hypothetical protein